MNITRETIKDTLRTVMAEETEYQIFFKKALEKAGKSIPSMSDEEKKEFFNKIDAAWNAKGEKNEDLKGDQHKLDVDGDGEIEASDLAALRAGKKKDESVNESAGCGCGCGCGGSKMNEEFKSKDSTFEKVYGIFDKRDYFNAKGLAKVQIGNFERALQKNDKGAQQILDKFKGDMDKAKEYIIQVISDQKKQQAFEDYKALKAAVDSIQKGNPITGAVDLVKSRAHNNTQKYTMALYSALRGKKFNNYKDIHTDVDSLIGESLNEDANMNKKVKQLLDKNLKELTKGKPNHQFAVMHILMGALSDANFHSEAKQVAKLFPRAKYEGDPMAAKDVEEYYHYELGPDVANICKWDGKDIVMAMGFYISMTIGRPLGQKVETLVESVNEARLGKVAMLKDVEAGRTSSVEGVKISKDLAFEMRMFLQRPMLSRSRTGIAIDNSQMKEAIPMLAKVGIQKRLSSGVKKEFAELLKKYK